MTTAARFARSLCWLIAILFLILIGSTVFGDQLSIPEHTQPSPWRRLTDCRRDAREWREQQPFTFTVCGHGSSRFNITWRFR